MSTCEAQGCKSVSGMSGLCLQHKCHNSKCSNFVFTSNEKLHYYCSDHMNCGKKVINQMCRGCLQTYQKSEN